MNIHWLVQLICALLSEVGDNIFKSGLKALGNSQDIFWRFQLIIVLPNINEQLLLRKQSAILLDLEMATKLEDKVARLLITLTGRIVVELDHVA